MNCESPPPVLELAQAMFTANMAEARERCAGTIFHVPSWNELAPTLRQQWVQMAEVAFLSIDAVPSADVIGARRIRWRDRVADALHALAGRIARG